MSPLEERLLQLKAEIENLKITAEESELGYKKAKEFRDLAGNFDVKTEKGKEGYVKTLTKNLDSELNYLRDKANLLSKVSPNTTLILEQKINDYEKTTKNLLNFVNETETEYSSEWEVLSDLISIGKLFSHLGYLHDIVNVACNSLLDTIDFLEGKKNLNNDA